MKDLTHIRVTQAIEKDVLTVPPDTRVADLGKALSSHIHQVLVRVGMKIVGVLTMDCLARYIAGEVSLETTVGMIMRPMNLNIDSSTDLLDAKQAVRSTGLGCAPVFDQDSNFVGILTTQSICDGFSERLKYVVDYLETLIDCLQEAICVVQSDGRVQHYNNMARDTFKCLGYDIDSDPIQNILTADLHEIFGKGRQLMNIKVDIGGKTFLLDLLPFPICQEGREPVEILIFRDITEIAYLTTQLVQTNEKMHLLEEQIRALLQKNQLQKELVVESGAMKAILAMAQKVASTPATILIRGESGTGKEVIANYIHENSLRRDGHFIKINCSAIPSNLFESEFFGHEKGAFTGAHSEKLGLFELADGGTLFLDEIGELPVDLQAKLLRVLQEQTYYRVGGTKPIRFDVRFIVATNCDLDAMVEQGSFRRDLYYRINVISLHIPALRERREDVLPLLQHFCQEFCARYNVEIHQIDPAVLKALLDYDYPGNVRELRNLVERMVVLSEGGCIMGRMLPETFRGKVVDAEKRMTEQPQLGKELQQIEKERIAQALRAHGYNKSKTAKELNISRGALYYKMKMYNLE